MVWACCPEIQVWFGSGECDRGRPGRVYRQCSSRPTLTRSCAVRPTSGGRCRSYTIGGMKRLTAIFLILAGTMAADTQVGGTWEGKANDLPAVELTIRQENSGIQG